MQAAGQRRFMTMAILLTVAASIIASGVTVAFHITKPSDTIMRGVYVAGVHVGGMTPEQARLNIDEHMQQFIQLPITIRLMDDSWHVPAEDLGVILRHDEMANQAFAIGRSGPFWRQMRDRLRVARQGVVLPMILDMDEKKLSAWLDKIAPRFEQESRDARIVPSGRGVEIASATAELRLDRHAASQRILSAATRLDPRTVHLTLAETAPHAQTAEARYLGIHHLMGAFTTTFNPSDQNRSENIRIAAQALDQTVLMPGEEFSFNRNVGPRIESEGYREAPVIIDGELVPDIGGGVCQVSSTLYNAVLLAGLTVTHRAAHSIPSTYVPLGFDAAVAYDFMDFRFKNSAQSPMLIRAWVDHDQMHVAFYGTTPRYENVRLKSEIVEIIEPAEVHNSASSLNPGERRVMREGRRGYRVNVWRITEVEGHQERALISHSFYRPRDQVVVIGAQTSM